MISFLNQQQSYLFSFKTFSTCLLGLIKFFFSSLEGDWLGIAWLGNASVENSLGILVDSKLNETQHHALADKGGKQHPETH